MTKEAVIGDSLLIDKINKLFLCPCGSAWYIGEDWVHFFIYGKLSVESSFKNTPIDVGEGGRVTEMWIWSVLDKSIWDIIKVLYFQ